MSENLVRRCQKVHFFLPSFVCDIMTPPQDSLFFWVTRRGENGMPDFLDPVGDKVVEARKRHEMNGSRRDAPLADMICAPLATFVLINL